MPRPDLQHLTLEEWFAEGRRRFGPDMGAWRFVCPSCGFVAAKKDWDALGAPEGAIGFACVGRWIEGSRPAFDGDRPGPCTYTGGGLFQYNPIEVTGPDGESTTFFDFAEAS